MKILYITCYPSPYRVDFFNEMGKKCDLTVLFEEEPDNSKDREASWFNEDYKNFKAVFLKTKHFLSMAYSVGIKKWIKDDKWDIIVVCGYVSFTKMIVIRTLKKIKRHFFMEVDGGIVKQESRIKYSIKRYFISRASKWLSTGYKTSQYLTHYGADKDDIYIYPFTSLWEKDICKNVCDKDIKVKVREELNITEKNVVVTVGQFIHRKGFDVLLKASKGLKDTGVYIIGGKATEEYEKIILEYGLQNIHFLGFMAKEELHRYYEAADVFVLPTREDIWGLVINEAMASALPVITTDNCIAGLELVKDDVNGYIVPVDNIDILAEKINKILSDDDLRDKMAKNSLKKIKEYTIENMAEEHIKIFNKILGEEN